MKFYAVDTPRKFICGHETNKKQHEINDETNDKFLTQGEKNDEVEPTRL